MGVGGGVAASHKNLSKIDANDPNPCTKFKAIKITVQE